MKSDSSENQRQAELRQHFRTLEYQIVALGNSDTQTVAAVGSVLTDHHQMIAGTELPAAVTSLLAFYAVRFGADYFGQFSPWLATFPGLRWTRSAVNLLLRQFEGQPVPDYLVIGICQTLVGVGPVRPGSDQRSTELFLARFHERFPVGFRPPTPRTVVTVKYAPVGPQAAAALGCKPNDWTHEVPDFFVEGSFLFAEILDIWAEFHGKVATSPSQVTGKSSGPTVAAVQAGVFGEVSVRQGKPAIPSGSLHPAEEPSQTPVEPAAMEAALRETAEVDALLEALISAPPASDSTAGAAQHRTTDLANPPL